MQQQIHGALVEVLGLGVLLIGSSGVGKSECALELVKRGHRLVADDVVRLETRSDDGVDRVFGHAPELIRHYMELRGVGLIRVPDLFGEESVADEAEVNLCCRLEPWREDSTYERIGLERESQNVAGVEVPRFELPVRPAGNMATLVEVAVRDQRERARGNNAAQKLDERLRGRPRAARIERDDAKNDAKNEAKSDAKNEAQDDAPDGVQEDADGADRGKVKT